MLGVFGRIGHAGNYAVQAQAVGLAGQGAEGCSRRHGNVIEAQLVDIAGDSQLGHGHVLGVEQLAVAFNIGRVGFVVVLAVVRAEDAVDVVDIGRGQGQAGQRFELHQAAIVGLFVLAPGHATDIALVVEVDALAAGHGAAVLVVIAQQGLVDLAAVRVGDGGVLGLTVAGGVETFVTDVADVVGLHQA